MKQTKFPSDPGLGKPKRSWEQTFGAHEVLKAKFPAGRSMTASVNQTKHGAVVYAISKLPEYWQYVTDGDQAKAFMAALRSEGFEVVPIDGGEARLDYDRLLAHARRMSETLQLLRPLAGSESLKRITGPGDAEEYFADYRFFEIEIKRLRDELNGLRLARAKQFPGEKA